jgi:hypothetical protein
VVPPEVVPPEVVPPEVVPPDVVPPEVVPPSPSETDPSKEPQARRARGRATTSERTRGSEVMVPSLATIDPARLQVEALAAICGSRRMRGKIAQCEGVPLS